jgi:hypothetical protein
MSWFSHDNMVYKFFIRQLLWKDILPCLDKLSRFNFNTFPENMLYLLFTDPGGSITKSSELFGEENPPEKRTYIWSSNLGDKIQLCAIVTYKYKKHFSNLIVINQ